MKYFCLIGCFQEAMRLIPIAFFLLPVVAFAKGDFTEFDKTRFINSTFACESNANCGNGSCAFGKCQCQYGYRDSTEAACDHEMLTPDRTTAWVLEMGLGLFFPAGWVHLGILPSVLTRLAIEGTSAGLLFGYFWNRKKYITDLRQEDMLSKWYLIGAQIFSVAHVASWIWSFLFFKQFDVNSSGSAKTWHKDQGDADLTVLADRIHDSLRITLDTFKSDNCAMVEQCVDGPGERALLRFSNYIYNLGKSDFVMGLEEVTPVWSPCHQHYHGPDTAKYFVEHQMRAFNGTVLKTIRRGHKQGYCYIDSENINSTYDGKFGCGIPYFTKQFTQGITAGWSDLYDSDTDCQWIDITGIAPGNYTLYVTVNPKGIYYQDADLTNNLSILEVEIPEIDKKVARTGHGQSVVSRIIQGPRS